MLESLPRFDQHKKMPRYELETYRKFIRDAAPFVSLVIGRKIHASEGDLLSDDALHEIAEKIDKRVDDLNADIAKNKPIKE